MNSTAAIREFAEKWGLKIVECMQGDDNILHAPDECLADLTALISEHYREKEKYAELLRQRDELKKDVEFLANWYNCIEEPIRDLVKMLRNNGINTFCSCGHGMWIQCETYEECNDLNTIYGVMCELKIKKYRTIVFDDIIDGFRYKHIEIQLPDENGEYYSRMVDNMDCKFNQKK